MSARKIRNTWWVDFMFKRHRYRKRSPENSMQGARVYEGMLRQRIASGEAIDAQDNLTKPHETVFKEFSQHWHETYTKTNTKPSTQRSVSVILTAHLIPYFGKSLLKEITSVDVERYKGIKQCSGLSPKTINNHLSVLHSCLNKACEWRLIDAIPRIGWLKAAPKEIRFLNSDECANLIDSSVVQPWHGMIFCGLHTGMRLGELCALEWNDIDWLKRRITVRRSLVEGVFGTPKSNRIRYIPMTGELYELFLRLRKTSGLVFVDRGASITCINAWKALQNICKQVGIPKMGWHTLRHTFASHLVSNGVPIRTVQILLGHSTVQMTERYAHLAPSTLHEAIDVLSNGAYRNGNENLRQPVVNTSFTPKQIA